MGVSFDVAVADVDETPVPGESTIDLVERLAVTKARAVDAPVVLGADTLVMMDDHVLGKPADMDEAHHMLVVQRGQEILCATGLALVVNGTIHTATRTTTVRLRHVSDDEIRAYLSTDEALDKAGALSLQGGAKPFIERVDGCFTNVMGFPTCDVTRLLGRAAVQASSLCEHD